MELIINNPRKCWEPGFADVAGEDLDKDTIDVNLINWNDKIDVFNALIYAFET